MAMLNNQMVAVLSKFGVINGKLNKNPSPNLRSDNSTSKSALVARNASHNGKPTESWGHLLEFWLVVQ